MTDIELLPSSVAAFVEALKGERGSLDAWLEVNNEREVAAHVEAYARASVEHNVAAKDAEIEALRAEAIEWRGLFGMAKARADKAEARAERLAEALRRQRDWWLASKGEAVSNAPGGLTRIDPGFISLCDAHVQQIDLALRDHDQEGKDG